MKYLLLCLISVCVLFTADVKAQSVSINAGSSPYSQVPAAQGVGIGSIVEIRIAALTALAGMYRATHGVQTLPAGTTFKVTWQDGSSEYATVISLFSSVGVTPIAGTQVAAGGTGGDSSGGYWEFVPVGQEPVYQTGVTCVDGYCESQLVLVGWQTVWGWKYSSYGQGPGRDYREEQ